MEKTFSYSIILCYTCYLPFYMRLEAEKVEKKSVSSQLERKPAEGLQLRSPELGRRYSSAKYLFVVSHHPVYSNCVRGALGGASSSRLSVAFLFAATLRETVESCVEERRTKKKKQRRIRIGRTSKWQKRPVRNFIRS